MVYELEDVMIYTLYCVIKHGISPSKKREKIWGNDVFYYGNNGEILATIIVGISIVGMFMKY